MIKFLIKSFKVYGPDDFSIVETLGEYKNLDSAEIAMENAAARARGNMDCSIMALELVECKHYPYRDERNEYEYLSTVKGFYGVEAVVHLDLDMYNMGDDEIL